MFLLCIFTNEIVFDYLNIVILNFNTNILIVNDICVGVSDNKINQININNDGLVINGFFSLKNINSYIYNLYTSMFLTSNFINFSLYIYYFEYFLICLYIIFLIFLKNIIKNTNKYKI